MTTSIELNSQEIQMWIKNNFNEIEIENHLKNKGLQNDEIVNYIKEYKRTKYAQQQTTGFILLAIGSLTGFIGFILTVLNPLPSLYNFFLIGLTSIAAIIICIGLYCLLE